VGKIGRCYLKGLFCPEETVHSQRRKDFKKFLQGLGMKVVYGPAPARMAGARAGVTNYGKNCFAFANEAAGKSSWVVNEPYLVDRELHPDEPTMKVGCPENCQKCVEACPTGALVAPGLLDARRCLATWNLELKGISEGIAEYQPRYMLLDDAMRLVRTYHTARPESVSFNSGNGKMSIRFKGYSDVLTSITIFTENEDSITTEYLNIKPFQNDTIVHFKLLTNFGD
jgi:ferredoxin